MIESYIGIGSNIGDREENIEKAIKKISDRCLVQKKSSLYETEPIGFKEQNWFLNNVISIQTQYTPTELQEFLQYVEKEMGRIENIPNGPRVIDLDLLLYGNLIFNSEELEIPHPRFHQRKFVLVPLYEIAPDAVHPVLKKKVSELLQELQNTRGEEHDKVYLYRKNGNY